jgi:hypothetical protein
VVSRWLGWTFATAFLLALCGLVIALGYARVGVGRRQTDHGRLAIGGSGRDASQRAYV